MRYLSTNGSGTTADVSTALVGGSAPDGGLYLPEHIPVLPHAFFNNVGRMSMSEIAFVVATSFFGDDLDAADIKNITDKCFNIEAPVVSVGDSCFLELFHGPTLTFKDYGASFASQMVALLDKRNRRHERTVLVATTGNSGAATANSLFGINGIRVVVLFPKGVLSRMQMAQFDTLGGNVCAVEVDGTIEDCKNMVREAMEDRRLEYLNLTAANSINIGRIIPQIVFPLYAYAQLRRSRTPQADKATYAVPCGNYSNLTASLMAVAMGMPTAGIIGCCNINDSLRRHLRGEQPASSPIPTTAPSLDISMPSGISRLTYLLKHNAAAARAIVAAPAVDDREIASTILRLRAEYCYTADPHSAVAYAASHKVASAGPKIIFATGHPAKSLDIMTRVTDSPLDLPVQLNRFMGKRRTTRYIPSTTAALRRLLVSL